MAVRTLTLFDTTIGKKAAMAASGVVLFGFSIVHMIGNLQMFVGREAINAYHAFLYGMPSFLGTARAVLLFALVVHVVSAIQLAALNRRARPERYARIDRVATTFAARTMLYGGLLLLVYLVYHVAHTVVGVTAGLGYTHSAVDLYENQVRTYQVPWAVALNVAGGGIFGLHVYHGAWSMLQSLGLNHARYNVGLRRAAIGVALVVTAGFLAVPIAVFLGLVT
jgi:succinate dehydrogenase / fumarate reductase, cytochrome b subunit